MRVVGVSREVLGHLGHCAVTEWPALESSGCRRRGDYGRGLRAFRPQERTSGGQ